MKYVDQIIIMMMGKYVIVGDRCDLNTNLIQVYPEQITGDKTLLYKHMFLTLPEYRVETASGDLKINTTYNGSITFLNETVTPTDDITVGVKEEGVEHQLFYQASSVGTFTYGTGATATGNITVVLRHLPDKSASGVATGDITNAGGSTDVFVTFPVKVVN